MLATRFAKIAAFTLIAIGMVTGGAVIAEGNAHSTSAVRAATVTSAAATPTDTSPGNVIWGGN